MLLRQGRRTALLWLVPLGLAACASPQFSGVDEAALREFVARGYGSRTAPELLTTEQDWRFGEEAVRVVLTLPQQPGPVPVVVYLPGLGEASAAGARWQRAWAAAGYAVLALQPLQSDAKAWQSALARDADFKALGRLHFAGQAMNQRLQRLDAVVARAQQLAGQAPWQRLDWSRLALAGFDLGAFTAMVAAGERLPGWHPEPAGAWRALVRASIVLSPFVQDSASDVQTRYRGIDKPLLSITSDDDGDPLGLLSTPALRSLPFDHMDGPHKWLLTMRGLSHTVLGGGVDGPLPRALQEPTRAAAPAGVEGGAEGGQQPRGARRSAGGNVERTATARDRGQSLAPVASPQLQALRLLAAQTVSTAFLDAYLKDQTRARAWLEREAAPWLGSLGGLQHK